jgi:hypothetical protein
MNRVALCWQWDFSRSRSRQIRSTADALPKRSFDRSRVCGGSESARRPIGYANTPTDWLVCSRQAIPLPDGIIHILNRQIRQRRSFALRQRGIQFRSTRGRTRPSTNHLRPYDARRIRIYSCSARRSSLSRSKGLWLRSKGCRTS